MKRFLWLLILILMLACTKNEPNNVVYVKAGDQQFYYQGRTDILNDSTVALISPGSYVLSNFSGDFCEVFLKAEFEPYNYVSLELDGKYLGRIKIESDSIRPYLIKVPKTNQPHTIKVFKESEASNGAVLFGGLKVAKTLPYKLTTEKYIEFIGNSITCGAAADGSVTPCDSGSYFDHQNVYYAYGPRVSRTLNVDFMLSSVSGIGIYRNWNDENIEEPIISQVYENLYLNTNNSKKFNFENRPDIVSICLGTNDLSQGDGVKPRLPFNRAKYVSNYIDFVKSVYSHYPNTQIVLLSSPMLVEEGNEIVMNCLKEIQTYFAEGTQKPILLFEFENSYNAGCSWHPSVEEHQQIADKLIPYFEGILLNDK